MKIIQHSSEAILLTSQIGHIIGREEKFLAIASDTVQLDKKPHDGSSHVKGILFQGTVDALTSDEKERPFITSIPDVGILGAATKSSRSLQSNYTCPESCNDTFCTCMYDYYNAGGKDVCVPAFTSACRHGEVSNCLTNTDDLAVGEYFYCPLFECFESSGIGMIDNETKASYQCYCDAYTNLCKQCTASKDRIPYCEDFHASYAQVCVSLIECCANETSKEGLARCKHLMTESFTTDSNTNATNTSSPVSSTDSATTEGTSNSVPSSSKSFVLNHIYIATLICIVVSGFTLVNLCA